MYQLLQNGEPVSMTKCDTIEEMIDCVRAFEQVWRDMYPDKADTSPYTIGTVGNQPHGVNQEGMSENRVVGER